MIAFLGLGGMGAPMAKRLLDAGHDLTVWNRSPAPTEELRALGAAVAPTPHEAASGADIVITMLADATALRAVLGDPGFAVEPDAVVVDMSTVGPAATAELAARFPAYVDAPVMGSVDRAATGELGVLASGPVDRVESVLKEFGHVVACGPVGRASALKVAVMGAVVTGIGLLSEAFDLARSMDVPDDQLERALEASPMAPLLGRARSTSAHFPVRLAAKDLRLALDQARLPMIEAAHRLLGAAADPEADLGRIVPSAGEL